MKNPFSFMFGRDTNVDHKEKNIRSTETEEEEVRPADTAEGESRSSPSQALQCLELIPESLYEFPVPRIRTCPEIQVVFFHGVEPKYSKRAFLDTWKSSDGSALWPTWLAGTCPNIRLLSVSYDCSAIRSSNEGNTDLYCTVENVIQDLVKGNVGVGKHKNCPLVLVGKDLGCLVIEAVCLKAKHKMMTWFLDSLKGFVFYSPPFTGPSASSRKFNGKLAMKLNEGDLEVSRNHHEFSQLRIQQEWVVRVMAAANDTGNRELLKNVSEPASRFGDGFYTAREDISTICRPHCPTSKTFMFLKNLIIKFLKSEGTVHKCQGLPTHLVGLMKKARELEHSLKGTSIVGITGMGGVGKSTLSKQLFNNISRKFEYTCFVEEVKQHSSVVNLENHMKQGFYKSGKRVQSMEWNDLQRKKTLLIMDDVDSDQQLKCLPPMHHMGDDSVVIITTRNKQVLRFFDTYIPYDLQCLGPEDAKRLFCQYAFGLEKMPESTSPRMRVHVGEVIIKCDGLPLTLEVLGRYLKGRENNLTVWTETIDKLSSGDSFTGDENDQVWRKLRVSYDALVPVEKEMFLDVATFFFGERVESACAAWKTEYGYGVTGWENLVERGLVKSIEGDGDGDDYEYGYAYAEYDDDLHDHGQLYDEDELYDHDDNRISMGRISKIWMHEHFRDLGKKDQQDWKPEPKSSPKRPIRRPHL